MKTEKKKKSLELRKLGYSLGEIAEKLSVSKSTVSLWTKKVVVSGEGVIKIKERSRLANIKSSEVLHNRKLDRLDLVEKESESLINRIKLNKDLALVALSIMYWCEGTKADSSVRFTNSDPELVRMFMKSFRQSFDIDEAKIRICVHLHDYHNEEEICNFWSEITKIPRSQFNKSYQKNSNHLFKKEGYKGCVRVSYHDAHISRVILSFAKKLIRLYI